jgi:hypothetical protein
MNSQRIKEIQEATAYPESVSVQQALLQVWNECEQELKQNLYTEEQVREAVFMVREGLSFVDPSPLDRLIEIIKDKTD